MKKPLKSLNGFSQALWLKRLYSQKTDLDFHVKKLKNWFSKRGYPKKVINAQINMELRSEESIKEKDWKHIGESDVPLVVTYKPGFKNLSFLIRENMQLLYADPETKRFLKPEPSVSLRSARNLKSFLVRSKVYQPQRKVGSAKRW